MNINRLKVGQGVWVMKEYPKRYFIIMIEIVHNEVWLDDGNNYSPDDLYSTEYRCQQAN